MENYFFNCRIYYESITHTIVYNRIILKSILYVRIIFIYNYSLFLYNTAYTTFIQEICIFIYNIYLQKNITLDYYLLMDKFFLTDGYPSKQ